jgi:methionyl-tRNA synthetase
MSKKPFYITTAISYVNGAPHLGHAYESILTDVMARFKRLDGYDVLFLTGTDEHGEKVARTAEKNGMDPKAFADQNAAEFLAMTGLLGISQDDFIRTTESRHYRSVQHEWIKQRERGDIYLGKYEGWYSVREEAYFSEDELQDGPGGQKLSPQGTEVEWEEEPSYFFRLSAYTDKLLEYYDAHPEFIQPQARRNEIISFVRQGLKDLSVSRHKKRLKWGIPVPDDDDHVMYVWLDALTNYITGAGYPDTESEKFQTYWPADYHVIGKDITRFHTVYWPAFLMSAGVELPKAVFAHGFINVQGQKMSKSLGNVTAPVALVETYGLDPLRYFLLREIPHGQDGNFGHEQAVARINADLANGLGNLAQRTLSMIYKNCDGKIPQPGKLEDGDQRGLLETYAYAVITKARLHAEGFQFHNALAAIWEAVSECDRYVDTQAPWKLRKENPERMNTVLYVLAEAVRCIGIAIQPYMPGSAAKLLDQLAIPRDERLFAHIGPEYALKPGTAIEQPVGVFPRIVEEDEQKSAAG